MMMKRRRMIALAVLFIMLFAFCAHASSYSMVPGGTVYGSGNMTGTLPGSSGSAVYQNPDLTYSVNRTYSIQVVPVYQFYSIYMRDYFWTTSEDEKNQLIEWYRTGRETYQYQGIAGFAEPKSQSWNTPVYRFWNKETMDHFYTASEEEKAALARTLKDGTDHYVLEGIAWYAPTDSGTPVYRFFDAKAFNHYYTSSVDEYQNLSSGYLAGTSSFRYEGIGWNWYE